MQEIKPEDVERLIREGKLHFGDELEFSGDGKNWTDRCVFRAFDAFCDVGIHFRSKGGKWYRKARFPRPDLRDGDPVFVRMPEGEWHRQHFSKFNSDGKMETYIQGRSKWSNTGEQTSWTYWLIPTKEELLYAGLDPNWYEGRRGMKC